MLPYNNLIKIDKKVKTPVYLQICNGVIQLIKEGVLKGNTRLPSSRQLSETVQVHRKTVVAAYEELQLQGWINSNASKGTYVSASIPETSPKAYLHSFKSEKKIAGFEIKKNEILTSSVYKKTTQLELNDGLPDLRLAPVDSLSSCIKAVIKGERGKFSLSYNDIEGNINLRNELLFFLNESRGFNSLIKNIFITRGSIMGFYLALTVLLKKGDNVIVAKTGYRSVNLIVQQLGGNLIYVTNDEKGLNVEEIEKLCKTKKIRAIYVTPHHHYPTTVTMPPERRMKLLAIAEKYKIAILEDDYDYDYHFSHSPYLPLATYDPAGVVIYIGSFSKTFSPAFRVGYIVAPQNLMEEITKLRRIIDRQGDSILEHAIAEMFKLGEIKSHLKKSHKIYKERRDFFCERLKQIAGTKIDFDIPEGGMAIWAKFDKKINLPNLAKEASSNGLFFHDGSSFSNSTNATRLGYASHTIEELEAAILILNKSIEKSLTKR
jgi:GntR family transcriptional regulator/MocR family aminotransferase